MNTSPVESQAIQILVGIAHANAKAKGFWDANSDVGNKVALVHCELSEFLERYRKDDLCPDEHCPKFTNQTIELADACIRIFDLAGYLNVPLGAAIIAKMKYNATRPHLHGKKF